MKTEAITFSNNGYFKEDSVCGTTPQIKLLNSETLESFTTRNNPTTDHFTSKSKKSVIDYVSYDGKTSKLKFNKFGEFVTELGHQITEGLRHAV